MNFICETVSIVESNIIWYRRFACTATAQRLAGPGTGKNICRSQFARNQSLQSSLSKPNITLIRMYWHIIFIVNRIVCFLSTVMPHYYADLDIGQSVVDHNFLPPGGNAKWTCLELLSQFSRNRWTMSMNVLLVLRCCRHQSLSLPLASLQRFVNCSWDKYVSHKNQINSLKCNLVCNTNIILGWSDMLPLHRKSNRFRDAKPTCQMLTQGTTGAWKYEFVIRIWNDGSMLSGAS